MSFQKFLSSFFLNAAFAILEGIFFFFFFFFFLQRLFLINIHSLQYKRTNNTTHKSSTLQC